MNIIAWLFRTTQFSEARSSAASARRGYQPQLEQLEDRSLPSTIHMAAIGANSGQRDANQIFSSGDLHGTIDRLTSAQFNAMSVQQLRNHYDVLLFTWNSSGTNAAWATRILPYLQLGGGVIWEDNNEIGQLAPEVNGSSGSGHYNGTFYVTSVPTLTDGIPTPTSLTSPHFHINSFASDLHALLTSHNGSGTTVESVYGQVGAGRIIVSGPDFDYHGNRNSGGSSGRMYHFLLDEVTWVSQHVISPQPHRRGW